MISFSGIQPTGIPHIGNYLGAIKHWVNASQINCYFSIVDVKIEIEIYSCMPLLCHIQI